MGCVTAPSVITEVERHIIFIVVLVLVDTWAKFELFPPLGTYYVFTPYLCWVVFLKRIVH